MLYTIRWATAAGLMGATAVILTAMAMPSMPSTMQVVTAFIFVVITVISVIFALQPDESEHWALMRVAMAQSDQDMPLTPRVTKNSLLYYALILEDMAEKASTLHGIMNRHTHNVGIFQICSHLADTREALEFQARSLKRILASNDLPDVRFGLTQAQAEALLDDSMDVHVTSTGFTIACGLPTDTAYAEVQRSNLTKANPETGKVDKTPAGKWIKGAAYEPPNLKRVLQQHWERNKLKLEYLEAREI